MSTVVKLRWPANLSSGLSRRDRQGCDYEAYAPDLLVGRSFSLEGSTAADVSDAEDAIRRLNQDNSALADSEAMARLLLRAEAVASSRIEGLEVAGRRLLQADLARGFENSPPDITATEVLNNIEAMHWAVETLSDLPELRVNDVLAVHERLLAGALPRALWRHAPRDSELDRGHQLQPVLGRLRSTAAGARTRAHARTSASSATRTTCQR